MENYVYKTRMNSQKESLDVEKMEEVFWYMRIGSPGYVTYLV